MSWVFSKLFQVDDFDNAYERFDIPAVVQNHL